MNSSWRWDVTYFYNHTCTSTSNLNGVTANAPFEDMENSNIRTLERMQQSLIHEETNSRLNGGGGYYCTKKFTLCQLSGKKY
jgi:hypothetical protein